jgi:hypothetical protein
MRYRSFVPMALLCASPLAFAQVQLGIGLHGVSLRLNLSMYPHLAPVPGYPAYYAPEVDSNYFFYDGMYWVYQEDEWYTSAWYNGPWSHVSSEAVPVFVLRIPVSYYRQPPSYFYGWRRDEPPRWGEHWGSEWERRRHGWDTWDHRSAPAPARLPDYQRKYAGDHYPRVEAQQAMHGKNYHHQPVEPIVRDHYQQQRWLDPTKPPKGSKRPDPPGKPPGQESPLRPQPLPRPPQVIRENPPPQPPKGQQMKPREQREPHEREPGRHPESEKRDERREERRP